MEFSGKTRKKLRDALISAFPQRSLLEQLLDFELEKKLNRITHDGNLNIVVYQLIQSAEAEGWLIDLVRVASTENSGNVLLKEIAQEILSTSELKLDLRQLSDGYESRELRQKIQKGDPESDRSTIINIYSNNNNQQGDFKPITENTNNFQNPNIANFANKVKDNASQQASNFTQTNGANNGFT